ncbi:MAG: KipI antagonist, partial [Bacteroidetes bacterium]|nr:KipI antagonist [Bacteroidota bacterium]
MKEIRVLEPGFLTSIQDLGRFGYAHLGVSASGAADSFALRIGNLLVGNKEESAGLEMTLTGGLYEFDKPCSVAITGSHFSPRLDSSEAPM